MTRRTIRVKRPRAVATRAIRWIGRGVGWLLLGAYLLVSRSLVIVLAVYLSLYFLIASTPFKQHLQQLLADALPGSISAATIKLGPAPWQLRVAEGRVLGVHDEEVIRVKAIAATIDWSETLQGLIGWLDGAHPLTFHFDHVDLLEPRARVSIDAEGIVGLERAFVSQGPAHPHVKTTTPGIDLASRSVRVIDAGAVVEAPGFRLEASGAYAVTPFSLSGHGDMSFTLATAHVNAVHMRFGAFSHLPEPLDIDVSDLEVEDFKWRGLGFEWRHASGRLDGGRFEGRGGLDASGFHVPWWGEAQAWLDEDSRIVETLSRGTVAGPLSLSVEGRGDVSQVDTRWQVSSPNLSIGPLFFEDLAAAGRFLPRGRPDAPRLHAIHVDQATARLGGGALSVTELAWDPLGIIGASGRDLSLVVALDGLDLGPPLAALGLPLLPGGRTTGALAVSHIKRPEEGASRIDVRVIDGSGVGQEGDVLAIRWDAPLLPGLPMTWLGSGALRYERRPLHRLDGKRVPLVEELTLEGLQVDAGPHRARLAGRIDLAEARVDLEPYLRLGEIADLAASTPLSGATGRLVLKGARIEGPLAQPSLRGVLNWTGAKLGGRDLGQVSGQVALTHGELVVRELRAASPLARLRLDGRVGLFSPGTWSPPTMRPFAVSSTALEGLLLEELTPVLGPEARLSVLNGRFKGHLNSGIDTLGSVAGEADVVITQAALGDERDLTIRTHIILRPGLGIALERLELTHPGGLVLRGRLELGPVQRGDRTLEGRLELDPTPLATLRSLQDIAPGLAATVRARITLGGSTAAPSIIGTIGLESVRYGPVLLGDASLQLSTRGTGREREVELAAFDEGFFPGFSLDRAVLRLDGLTPERFEAIVSAKNRRLSEFLPGLRDAPLDIIGSTAAEVEVDLRSGRVDARLRAAPEALDLVLRDRGLRWTHSSELIVVSSGGRLRLLPLTLRPRAPGVADAPTLTACGFVEGDALALEFEGALDLALVPQLGSLFSVAEGRLETLPDDAATEAAGPDACFPASARAISVRGALRAPVIVGRLGTSKVALVPRGSGRELRILDGSTLALRSVGESQQRIILGDDGRFAGEIDDGEFSVAGHIDLVALQPEGLDLRITGNDLAFQSTGEFAIEASPDLRVLGRTLGTSPVMSITGDLALTEGRYSKSFDTFARAVGGALGGRDETYTTSVLETTPWLREARLDVNVTASDFEVQAALPLARTDLPVRLDLTVQGTIDKPRIFRRVDLLPGGTLAYFLFERTFTVNSGALDFDGDPEHPLVEVTAQTPITYLQRAQTALQEEDEKEVTITLKMSGRLPDLKIELSSDDPTFDQADIQSLLLTGKPRSDVDQAQENRLVSADLSNVINTVLAAPFVRRASVGLDQKGSLEYRVGTCFAPNLCFDTTTISDDTETTVRARFSLSIGDDVICEGTLRRSDGVTATDETYEARCRYRIPLE